ncbi:hypothetical protein MTR67_018218 [Solanum verrucosum]|uniref:Reverse transcriptase zinc-binding domain n=2 Tax=Solanum verrucosum TaxID=315347 RepID=A0AAF0TTI2_SOLVR|nr:hypothetical protein MTR67_018218 [Solanum verrucosum]
MSSVYKLFNSYFPLTIQNDYNWIWYTHTLGKIRFFLWLCVHNCLPTNSYLFRLNITSSGNCPICNSEEETIPHIFLRCPIAIEFWTSLNISIPSDHPQWILHFLQSNQPLENRHLTWTCFLPFALWHIWLNRNNNVFKQCSSPVPIPNLISRVLEFLFSTKPLKKDITKINFSVKWFPPSCTGLKFNFDGAFNSNSLNHGIGVVFRDSAGNWSAGFFNKAKGINACHMELQAFHEGLMLAISKNLSVSEIETDAIDIINMLDQPPPLFSNLLSLCRSALRNLENPQIRYNFREGNKVAHKLATEGPKRATTYDMVFLMEPPPWLFELFH